MFQEWASKSHVTVKRNPDYNWGSTLFKHQGRGYPDRSRPSDRGRATRMATLETGRFGRRDIRRRRSSG